MKITGIICEYNPLHNGHLYQIQQVRKNGAEAIVAVMSGNFMQRGDVAVMDKFTRAKLAVEWIRMESSNKIDRTICRCTGRGVCIGRCCSAFCIAECDRNFIRK